MTPKKPSVCTLVVVCLLALVIVNLMMTIRLTVDTRASTARVLKQPSLPCRAIPTRFPIEEPECAEKLLRSMNISSVHIQPGGPSGSLQDRVVARCPQQPVFPASPGETGNSPSHEAQEIPPVRTPQR